MSDRRALSVSDRLRSAILKLLSHRVFSRLFGKLADLRKPRFFVKWVIRRYIRLFDIETNEVEHNPMDYPSLGDFFVRRLKSGARPIEYGPGHVVSPVDALVMTAGDINDDACAFQIKGSPYAVADLMTDADAQQRYRNGTYVQLYLSPRDYHRIHFPVNGRITEARYEPGRLYPVNTFSVNTFPRVLTRNERVLLQLSDGEHNLAMALVGALNVGRIGLTLSDFETNRRGHRTPGSIPLNRDTGQIGDELAYFRMGSTVILFFQPGEFELSVKTGDCVLMGQRIGTWS